MTEHILDKIAKMYFGEEKEIPEEIKQNTKHDLKNPPGIVGQVTNFINSQCRYPLENLATISAIVAVGNIGGLNHIIKDQKLSSNLFAFGIAGSGTGKESIMQAFTDIHIEAGISGAVHGSIKSEQEIIRNLIRNQSALYNIDELGIFLRKLNMSQKSGGASYLQGVIGMLMSAYSKAHGNLLLSGDVKEEVKTDLNREYAALNKKLDEGHSEVIQKRLDAIQEALNGIDKGLKHPFLSMIGYSTPSTFNESVSFEQITSGFIGRSIIINEPNTNPRAKENFICPGMHEDLKYAIRGLCANGEYDSFSSRVEANGAKIVIDTTLEATQALRDASDWFFDEAEKHTEKTGFEAVVRRGYEMVEKVSFILAMGSTERTIEHVEWANEYIRRDIEYKTLLAYSNVKEKTSPVESMAAKILCSVGTDGITVGKIVNKYRAKKQLVEDAIEFLVEKGKIYTRPSDNKFSKKGSLIIFKA